MLPRNAIRVVASLGLLILVGAVPVRDGWLGLRPARAQVVTRPDADEASRRARSEDEDAIRAVDAAYVRDFNKGDGKALTALFTEDAEVIEANGDRYQGRDLIGGEASPRRSRPAKGPGSRSRSDRSGS